jgi:hypothetical protein
MESHEERANAHLVKPAILGRYRLPVNERSG